MKLIVVAILLLLGCVPTAQPQPQRLVSGQPPTGERSLSSAGGDVAAENPGASSVPAVSLKDLWLDVSMGPPLVEWFNSVASPQDIARADHVAQIRLLDDIGEARRLVVFKSATDAEQAVPLLADRIHIIGYNLESGPANPADEQAAPVESVRRMQELAHDHGLLLAFGPDRTFALSHGVEVAPFVDIFVIQIQRIQTDSEAVRSFVQPLVKQLRAVNPDIQISVQVRTEGDVSALVDLIDELKQDLDGVSVLTSPETVEIAAAFVEDLRTRPEQPAPSSLEEQELGESARPTDSQEAAPAPVPQSGVLVQPVSPGGDGAGLGPPGEESNQTDASHPSEARSEAQGLPEGSRQADRSQDLTSPSEAMPSQVGGAGSSALGQGVTSPPAEQAPGPVALIDGSRQENVRTEPGWLLLVGVALLIGAVAGGVVGATTVLLLKQNR